jgi:hypothetical protein
MALSTKMITTFKAPFPGAIGQISRMGTHYRYRPRAPQQVIRLSPISRLYHAAASAIYGKLDHVRNQIRVVKIVPGRWEDDLSCSLKVISLDGLLRTRYDTLSYTWGNPADTRMIRVDQQDIDVSANLFMALRALRCRFSTATVWADALCINQNDDDEKSKQVALMGRIYKQGRQTWVSLGCPDEKWADRSWSATPHIREKAHLLKRLVRSVWRVLWHNIAYRRSRQSRLGIIHTADAIRIIRTASLEHDLDAPGQTHTDTAISMLTWLACHDYWSRVWIVQEVALSARHDPICLFGRHQVPLLELDTLFANWLTGFALSSDQRSMAVPSAVGKGMDRAMEICMLRDEFLTMRTLRLTGSMELLRALQFASYRRASVAHDHVYGIRSLLPTKEQESLQPDYSLSIRELYASVSNLLLRRQTDVALLSAAVGAGQANEHNLPSWTLDFSKPLKLPARTDDPGNSEEIIAESIEVAILRIRARSTGEHISACALNDTWQELASHPTVSRFLSQDIYEEDSYSKGHGQLAAERGFDGQSSKISSFFEQSVPAAHAASSFSSSTSQGHGIFSTSYNRIGKCSHAPQTGDEIWTFVGSEKRFLLRPSAGADDEHRSGCRYRLVGPCIVYPDKFNMQNSGLAPELIELV